MKVSAWLMLSLLLFLVGCSSTASESPKNKATLSAAIGTLNYSDRVGTSFMFAFNLDTAPPPEGFEVKIFGPRGWNGGDPASRTYLYKEAGRHATWNNVFRDNDGNYMEAMSGPYIVQAVIDGETHRTELDLNASEVLPKPTNLVIQGRASTVNATWTAVPGAVSYLVSLNETETSSLDEPTFLYTKNTEAGFEGLNLTVGGEYWLGVSALPIDFTEGAAKAIPQAQFNTSYKNQKFTVTAE